MIPAMEITLILFQEHFTELDLAFFKQARASILHHNKNNTWKTTSVDDATPNNTLDPFHGLFLL